LPINGGHYLLVESFSKGKNLTLSITGGSPELIVLLKTHYPADLLKTTTFSLAKTGHKFFWPLSICTVIPQQLAVKLAATI
jgi:hypothetical protein